MGNGYKGPRPSYFLPSHFDYPPDGPVKLGNLISDLNDPGNRLNQADFVPIKKEMRMPATKVEKYKGGVKESNDKELGLCAKAVYQIGLKAGLGLTMADARVFSATLSCLETHAIMPDDDYVERSMMTAEVQRKLKGGLSVFRKPVFMITALKIAYPAPRMVTDDDGETTLGNGSEEPNDVIQTEWDGRSKIEGSIRASGEGPGAPAAVEARGKEERKVSIPASFVPVTPFVYAFAVRQCFYSWKKKPDGHRPYTKGALASHDPAGRTAAVVSLKNEEEKPEEVDFSFLEVAEDPLDLEQLAALAEDFEAVDLWADEEEGPCQLIIGKRGYQVGEK